MASKRRKKEEETEIEEIEEPEEKPRKRKIKPERKKREPGMDSSVIYKSGEMPRMRSGGVAKKLALHISAAIVIIMVVFFIVIYNVVTNALDDQINAGGVVAARLLAAPDVDTWKYSYGEDEAEDNEDKAVRKKFNQSRLSNLLKTDSQLMNATILVLDDMELPHIRRDARGDILENKENAPQFKPDPGAKIIRYDDVDVEFGTINLGRRGTQLYKCRSYAAPIKDHKGGNRGFSRVVLSEALIDERKASLALTIVILTVVFIGIGVVVAFFLGNKITKPIKALTEDMAIVAGGNLNHHTVPKSTDEVGLLARTFDKMTRNLQEGQAKEMELAAQRHQLAVAQEVQSNLLPSEIPEVPGYEIVAFHRSSKEVDGNYYDVIQYPDGKVGVLVAAASGKGVPAAMVMTMARSFFRALVEGATSPAKMLIEANRLLSPDLRAGMYVEVLMVLLDPETHKAKLVSAGPTSLFRYNAAAKKLQGIQADGIALGFDKGPVFDKSLNEVEFDIAAGDRLVLNTPGLFSLKNPDGVELGTVGFAKAINKHATKESDSFVNLVVNIVDNFAGKEVDETDITFLTVRRKEA
jgi:serine phosphatase RsbU (regulator of sigma subunit)